MKDLNQYIAEYKSQLKKGDILIAYDALVKFVMQLRTNCIKNLSHQYKFTGILHGYLDYTYFYYSNTILKDKKLKLGLVLNHLEMRFEIWLLGNTTTIQKEYWNALKTSKWNVNRNEMPKYSIIEAIIESEPDFNNLPKLSKHIEQKLVEVSNEIINSVEDLN